MTKPKRLSKERLQEIRIADAKGLCASSQSELLYHIAAVEAERDELHRENQIHRHELGRYCCNTVGCSVQKRHVHPFLKDIERERDTLKSELERVKKERDELRTHVNADTLQELIQNGKIIV